MRGWRRRLSLTAGALVVAVAGAGFAWQAFAGSADKPESRSEALSGPAGTEPLADFDNDGLKDTIATGTFTDAVSVLYGSRKDAKDAKDAKDGDAKKDERRQRVTMDSPGVPGKERRGVSFGRYNAARDFDEDGYTDVLASVESTRKDTRAGIIVLWGSSKGLAEATYLDGVPKDYQSTGVDDDPLVAGDFNGDEHADVVVRLGSRHGLLKGPFDRDGKTAGRSAVPDAFTDPDGEDGSIQLDGAYGGDLNGDGTDDLITSQVTEDDGMGGGEVESSYVAGGPDGFREPDTELLPGIEGATTGDVDKDGYTDILLRRYPKGTTPDSAVSGPIEVFHGSENGPDPKRHTEIDQDSPGVPGKKKENSTFGASPSAGDANGDGYADVALDGDEGSVTVLRGGPKGLTGHGARNIEDPSPASESSDEQDGSMGNRFSAAVRLGDTNGDGMSDLAVGAPNTGEYVGALWIFPAEKDEWPEDAARSYGPRDFGDPDAPDDEEFGAQVR